MTLWVNINSKDICEAPVTEWPKDDNAANCLDSNPNRDTFLCEKLCLLVEGR